MSDKNLARRSEISIVIDDVDVTHNIRDRLLALTYTDNEEDKTDDLQVTIEDKGDMWLGAVKGSIVNATIIQKNKNSDGKDNVLDLGIFEIDTVDYAGPPSTIALKCTSLPYKSTIRKQDKTKAWENINLKALANEIATTNGMGCMYESSSNPFYSRKEQIQCSDITFLQALCKNAGISLKVTANLIVLFDSYEFEQKAPVKKIIKGSSDVNSYRFSSKTNDVTYSSCHVIYTDPNTKKTYEHTYKPRDSEKGGQVLEVNEKVSSKEEARKLAMKKLRQKNKGEFEAEFNLYGDVSLVAGVTVQVVGYGAFDGKYIISTATHKVTGGHTVGVKLRRVLEGY